MQRRGAILTVSVPFQEQGREGEDHNNDDDEEEALCGACGGSDEVEKADGLVTAVGSWHEVDLPPSYSYELTAGLGAGSRVF